MMTGIIHNVTVLFLLLSAVILAVALHVVWKIHRYCSKDIKRILIVAICASVFHILTLMIENEKIALLFFGLFSASISWLVLFFKMFSYKYTKTIIEVKAVVIGCIAYCIFDTIGLIANVFTPVYFSLNPVDFHGELFYIISPDRSSLYSMHLIFSYVLISLVLLENVLAIIKSPKFYRRKYVEVLFSFMIPVFIDVFYTFFHFPVDISVFAFGIGGIVLAYFSLFYSPSEVRRGMLFNVFDDTSIGVVCFDKDGIPIFVNNLVKEIYEIPLEDGDDYNILILQNAFEKWKEKNPDWKTAELTKWSDTFERNGKKYYYDISCSPLIDSTGSYLGSYFTINDNTELMERLNEQKFLARHDNLTGLYNREHFYIQVKKLFEEQPDRDFVIITSNIKNFKLVNDVFGMKAGDKVLCQIADALKELAKEGSVYGRFQGDSFCLCMPAERFSEETFTELAYKAVSVDGSEIYKIRFSMGVYRVTNKSLPVSVMCDRSFLALSSIKNDYSKTMAFYSDNMRDKALHEQTIATMIEEAMLKEQFTIYIQPQVDPEGNVSGGEALVRWFQPDKGIVLPGEFIPIFEKTGAITKLDYCVWERACQTLKKWKDEGHEDYYLSVNISPKDFLYTDVYRDFTTLVNKYGIDPSKLNLEITESAIVFDLEKQIRLIKALQDFGFKIEMDDFGSGYSSLNSLKDIEVDVLKLDMAFLSDTGNKERSKKIISIVLEMAKELNLPVISEGVEKKEHVDFLKKTGCSYFQGNYFSEPMSISEFENKYMK